MQQRDLALPRWIFVGGMYTFPRQGFDPFCSFGPACRPPSIKPATRMRPVALHFSIGEVKYRQASNSCPSLHRNFPAKNNNCYSWFFSPYLRPVNVVYMLIYTIPHWPVYMEKKNKVDCVKWDIGLLCWRWDGGKLLGKMSFVNGAFDDPVFACQR